MKYDIIDYRNALKSYIVDESTDDVDAARVSSMLALENALGVYENSIDAPDKAVRVIQDLSQYAVDCRNAINATSELLNQLVDEDQIDYDVYAELFNTVNGISAKDDSKL